MTVARPMPINRGYLKAFKTEKQQGKQKSLDITEKFKDQHYLFLPKEGGNPTFFSDGQLFWKEKLILLLDFCLLRFGILVP